MPLTITPVSGGTGAIAEGIDLRQPVSDADRRRLNAAVVEHIALCVRGQDLTPATYLDAVGLFGEPMEQQYAAQFAHPDQPIVQVMSNQQRRPDGQRYRHGPVWHTDHAHVAEPPNFTTLYALEVPSRGGATCLANMHKAYAALPADERRRLDELKVVTSLGQGAAALANSTKSSPPAPGEAPRLGEIHPLIRTHPVNGRNGIYFHAIKVEYLDGMTSEESKALLADLLARATVDAFVYRHAWQVGDLLIWDNRSALHQAAFDYDPDERRVLWRTILKGERPFGPAMPKHAAAE